MSYLPASSFLIQTHHQSSTAAAPQVVTAESASALTSLFLSLDLGKKGNNTVKYSKRVEGERNERKKEKDPASTKLTPNTSQLSSPSEDNESQDWKSPVSRPLPSSSSYQKCFSFINPSFLSSSSSFSLSFSLNSEVSESEFLVSKVFETIPKIFPTNKTLLPDIIDTLETIFILMMMSTLHLITL